MHECPNCKNQFHQPLVCTTCGAERLHDETLRVLTAQVQALQAQVETARQVLTEVAIQWSCNEPYATRLMNETIALLQPGSNVVGKIKAEEILRVYPHGVPELNRIATLTDKLEAAEKDAARYQYAQKYLFVGIVGPEGGQTVWLDEQIDAAIKKQY